jgi:DDE family transposase/D-isomer specific 2-hydroxyacid dehydrogenase-like protein
MTTARLGPTGPPASPNGLRGRGSRILRQPGKVQHQGLELFRQRIFGIACGYADCNDAARVVDDAIHKLLLGRDPIAGGLLASQPTLSRFENSVGPRELRDMAHVLADTVIEPSPAPQAALKTGRIAGAALDVHEHEPTVNRELIAMNNVVVTPHLGSAVGELREEMALFVADNILAVLEGRPPQNVANPAVFA